MKIIDDVLDKRTMYQVVLYNLIGYWAYAFVLTVFGLQQFNVINYLLSSAAILFVCLITNWLFAWAWDAIVNIESVYITALILMLIITPASSLHDLVGVSWICILAIASKFIIAYKAKHLFNPAAFGAFIVSITLGVSASWWVAQEIMLPIVLIGGLLVVRKVRKFSLFLSFLFTYLVAYLGLNILNGQDLLISLQKAFFISPVIFFGTIMLTEPLTLPPTRMMQMLVGGLAGLIFIPQMNIASFYFTPEITLLVVNILSFAASPKQKLILHLKQKIQLAPSIYDFIFSSNEKLNFLPGQYLEWTIDTPKIDSRGNRRYFTISSSPTEPDLRLGVKFSDKSSQFKTQLLNMKVGDQLVAGSLAGDFVLKDANQKYLFIAGGIGITPFRSIIKNLVDTNTSCDIDLVYACKDGSDFVYQDVFESAKSVGLKVHYLVTDTTSSWSGPKGFLTNELLTNLVPDFTTRKVYLSGPRAMILSYEKLLHDAKISPNQIKTDFFPGL